MVSETFRTLHRGRHTLRVAPLYEDAAHALGLLEDRGLEALLAAADRTGGRARTTVVALPGHGQRLHLRPVRHGGWLGGLWRGRILGLARPLAELESTAWLRRAGAPVPAPVLVAGRRQFAGLWTASLGTVYEEGSEDGGHFLAGSPRPERVARVAAAAARAVRRLHDAGASHPDLHVGNLLVESGNDGVGVHLVDLDGVQIGAPPSSRERMADLMRLHRSLVKRDLRAGLTRRAHAAFLAAYTEGDRSLRKALLGNLPREQRRLRVHQLGYRVRRSLLTGERPPTAR